MLPSNYNLLKDFILQGLGVDNSAFDLHSFTLLINMESYQAIVISGEDTSSHPIFQRRTSGGHPFFSSPEIEQLNLQLSNAQPQEVLAWAMKNIPRLFQTTAFGLTGLATLDMIHKLSSPGAHQVPLIFINTLYHFPETLALAAEASQKYQAEMHVYMPPAAQSVAQFEALYGENLWEIDEESYDYLVKV